MSLLLTDASPMLDAIDSVMAAHRRLTGRDLDWRTAVRRVERLRDGFGCFTNFPLPGWHVEIMHALVDAGYSDGAIRAAVDHADRHKTVAGCDWLEERDAECVGALIPFGRRGR